MKRFSLLMLATLAAAGLLALYSYTARVNLLPQTSAQTTKSKRTVLVKKLPDSVEGVELAGDMVRLKAGYKFVKEPDNTVTVARMKSSTKMGGGKWTCACSKDGECLVSVSSSLDCLNNGCKGTCDLQWIDGATRTSVLRIAR